ncbi:MAG: sugar phosphorylase, partial [Nitriliruptorales bacterium]|nr:sugar phosphorylase [Nitriliruptorales bacterium]
TRSAPFDERDVVLITYGDQVTEAGRAPLATLADFLTQHVQGVVTGVHILPFYPSTSDDGFAVVDYDAVDPALGDWDDIEHISSRFRLMVDAVFNHVSASSPWFESYRKGDPAYEDFFIAPPRGLDVSQVIRPRSTPLLTAVECADGSQPIWTTFSADQVDLNFTNPEVLLTVTGSLLGYLAHGADILRLDAVAFLWKEPGTSCIHLQPTHEVVQLWRTVVDLCSPGTLIITETNVPHVENISYFGNGTNEAHLVYQFPLAPLILSTFHLADTRTLHEWAAMLSTPSEQTAFLNFLGSHDGIGLRPAEGLLTRSEIGQLGELARAHGGGVSSRADGDGRLSPYELNTVLFDALTPADSTEPLRIQVDRFLSAHSLLLALAGVPAVYVQSLLGSRNWHEGAKQTGRLRSINRQKFDRRQLERELADVGSRRHQVFARLMQRIRTRIAEPAFHPNGPQRLLDSVPALFALERMSVDGSSSVLCIHNVSGRPQRFQASGLSVRGGVTDLVTGEPRDAGRHGTIDMEIGPYGVAWLRGRTW